MRGGEGGLLLQETFLTQVQHLNPGVVDYSRAEDLAKRLIRVLPRIEGNLEAWEYLRGLKTVFVPQEKRERNVHLLSEDWEQNTYHVTDELRFYNGKIHAKGTLIDDTLLIIGSQNMHYSSWGEGGLTEYSMATNDPQAIAEYQALFEAKWQEAVPFEEAEFSTSP